MAEPNAEDPVESQHELSAARGGQWHFDPDSYLRMVRAEVPAYDRLQSVLANATAGRAVRTVLDLGSGTGVTAHNILRMHPDAELTGIDSSEDMLMHARRRLPGATFLISRLEDHLPTGPFDLIVSALAIHHLDGEGKADLFRRVALALAPRGRFVFLDVVVARAPVPKPVPIEAGVDLPSTVDDLLHWLREADLATAVLLDEGDLAVIAGDRRD